MTSKQVMLTVTAFWMALTGGCALFGTGPVADPLASPYPTRQVWAVAPLRNESGSLQPDGARIADQLQRHLENAANIDVLSVNRVIEAMNALRLAAVSTPDDALALRNALGCDGLIVGTITAYDPYDPPKLGLAIELYLAPGRDAARTGVDVRRLSTAATEDQAAPESVGPARLRPTSVVSAVFDAGDPYVRSQLQRYANQRGPVAEPDSWRRYRISMDLFSEFASYVMSWRLLDAERRRLHPSVEKTALRQETPPALR